MESWAHVAKIVLGFVFVAGLGLVTSVNANSHQQLWQISVNDVFENHVKSELLAHKTLSSKSTIHSYEEAQLLTLNDELMRAKLGQLSPQIESLTIQAKAANTSEALDEFHISLPLPDGSLINVSLVKDSLLPEELAAKYPEIQAFKVLSNDRVFSGKVDISPNGFHAMLQMLDGEIIFIDPVELSQSQYAVFKKSAQKAESHRQHSCGVQSNLITNDNLGFQNLFSTANSSSFAARETDESQTAAAPAPESLKNYTIAIATTGEYSAKFGGSIGGTLGAITTTINRVNQILERDLGIHLSLAENNDLLINTDASSDPFTEKKLLDLVFQNQEFIDATIGNGNYDIGHLFTTSGGGLAAIASVCNNGNKAKGASGTTSPRGDSFDLDFVAHEIGHQLGATHTFNSDQGACNAETRTARSAFEPGSGSSIMSYAGYCGIDNIQLNTDAMYHIGSIKQITDYTSSGIGARCGVVKSSQNTPPQVDAGKDYSIPARTPFELSGTAVDSDNDALLYAWEQLDAGDASNQSADKGNNALFRVYAPTAKKSRSFPPLANVLNNTAAKGETLPKYQRTLTMSFVAQDNYNVAQSDEMKVQVIRTGSRFALNYPRTEYTRGSTYPIYWNVANTDREPINCASVNVWLSADGGQNFNLTLANNVPNTGEAFITIPADAKLSSISRFKIACSDNIFYAVSKRNFFVTENDNSISFEYPSEDQAEENLKDVSLTASSETSSSSVNTDSTASNGNSGGGLMNWLLYLLLLMLFCYRERDLTFRLNHRAHKLFNSFHLYLGKNCLF